MFVALFRTVVLYVLIILGIRLMGKRQVGELEPSELVFTLLIADLAAVPMQDLELPLWAGVIPILTLLSLTFLLSLATAKSVRLRAVLCGRPSIVVENGKLCQWEMRRNRITLDELHQELRLQGVGDLSTVRYAILETNGRLSVLLKAEQAPATAGQLGLKTQDPSLPTLLISDGRVMTENLKRSGLGRTWLDAELKRHHVSGPKEVFALSVDDRGKVFFAAKEKR